MDDIIVGDSVELIKTFPDECVDAVISDIPYGICYDEWDVLLRGRCAE